MKKIILVGYMGSGKSVIGEIFAKNNAIAHLDLDRLIEKECEMTVSEIFERKGELFFRKIEHKIFSKILKKNQNFVLSLGGGTPCYFNNHELLNSKNIVSIYLKASIVTLLDRLSANTANRPLLAKLNTQEQKEFIAKHLFERSFYYNQASNVISVDGKTVTDIVLAIEGLIR